MKSDAIKHSMYYGLILGATFILNFFLSQASGILWKIVQMFVVFSIPFLVFYITKNCRDEVNEGVMGYGAAFMYGVQLFFYASMVSSAFKYLYFKFIDPKFLKEMSAQFLCSFFVGVTFFVIEFLSIFYIFWIIYLYQIYGLQIFYSVSYIFSCFGTIL